ncbi:MAG: Ig-like domain-containing protein [Armatimonadota bacterium]
MASSHTSPVVVTTPVTFTATATVDPAGMPVRYKFVKKFNDVWTTLQDYSASNTCQWTPTQTGEYDIQVWSRGAGSTAQYQAVSSVQHYTVVPPNTAPSFDPVSDQATDENSGEQSVSITGVSPGSGAWESIQTVTFSAVSSNPTIIPNPIITGIGATRTLLYTPGADQRGTVTITLTAQDDGGTFNGGADTLIRTFTIHVGKLPTVSLTAPTMNQVIPPGTVTTLTATANDEDGTISKVEFYQGTTKLGEDTTEPYSYEWTTLAAATYTLTARAIDNEEGAKTSDPVNVIVNTAPVATPQTITINNQYAKLITLAGTDAESNPLTFSIDTYPSHGGLYLSSGATYIYCPNPNYHGPVSFTFKAADQYSCSAPATVSITTVAPPDATAFDLETYMDQAKVIDLTATDPQSLELTYSIYVNPTHGTLGALDPVTHNVEYSPAQGYTGQDWFSYKIGNGRIATVVIVDIRVSRKTQVALTTPLNGAKIPQGASVTLRASVQPVETYLTVSKVAFYQGTTKIGADQYRAPYAVTWAPSTPGDYTLTAVATDNLGNSVTSEPITMHVVSAPTGSRVVRVDYVYANGSDPLAEVTEVHKHVNGGAETEKVSYTYCNNDTGLVKTVTSPRPGTTTGQTVTTTLTYDFEAFPGDPTQHLGNIVTVEAPGIDSSTTNIVTYNYTTDGAYTQAAAVGQPLTVTNTLSQTVAHLRYNDRGQVESSTDIDGNTVTTAYNIAGQPTEVTYPATGQTGTGNSHTVYTYPYPGAMLTGVESHDESDVVTATISNTYDTAGNITGRSLNGTAQFTSSYDVLNHLVSLKDINQHETTYAYDALGRLTTVTNPDNTAYSYTEFDVTERVLTRVDANGAETHYTYDDPWGLLTGVDYAATTGVEITYSYNARGRLATISDTTGSQSYTYDELGNVLTETTSYTGMPTPWVLSNTYNPNGSRHTLTLPTQNGAGTITYGYDNAGRPTALTDYSPTPKTFSWLYKTNGRLDRQTLGNGAYTTYSYNAFGQLTGLTNYAPDATTRSAFTNFAYNGLGSMTQVAVSIPGVPDLTGTRSWGYDTKEQLTSDQYTGNSAYQHAFGYDNEGNITDYNGATLGYDNMNQLTTGGLVYDDNGNPTVYTGGAQLAYDGENRLTAYGTALTAGYNGDGLRAWKNAGGGRTYFLYDGLIPVAELKQVNDVWSISAVTIFGPTGLLARDDARGRTYYQFDSTGDVLQRLAEDGSVRSTDRYDAQGNLLNGGEIGDPYGYKGQVSYYTDAETGLVLCTLRYYDLEKGRWLTRDPIGLAGGLNLYAYCGGNPITYVDVLGLYQTQEEEHDAFFRGIESVSAYGAAGLENLAYLAPPEVLDEFQTKLDNVGMIPVIGEPIDGVNGVIYWARGDKVNAALSASAMIPVAGAAAVGIRKVRKADDAIRTIRNIHLAGRRHPITSVLFDALGYPIFKSKKNVDIVYTGSRAGDFAAANKAAGFSSTPKGYTWHHHQNGKTMQLVESEIHRLTGHTGGLANTR